jgi:carbon starvation protein CstA
MSGHDCLAMAAIPFVGPADEFSSFFLFVFDRNASLIPIDYLLSPADHAISSANVLICALCSPVGVVVHAPLLVPNLSVGAAQG